MMVVVVMMMAVLMIMDVSSYHLAVCMLQRCRRHVISRVLRAVNCSNPSRVTTLCLVRRASLSSTPNSRWDCPSAYLMDAGMSNWI